MAIVLNELQHKQIEENSKTKLQAFQRKIYLKAKTNPKYKFYCLYDKVFRKDTLEEAYKKVKASKGKGGVDGVEFKDLEGKEEELITEIQNELKSKTYKPNKLREVQIPKGNGKMRTLKIPTIKDRVVQMAVKLIIEPIFEADFKESSYGYRPKKSAHQAIAKLKKELFREIYKSEDDRKQVQAVDLTDCFNTIPHKELMHIVAQRIIDRQLLKLIKMFLRAGSMEAHDKNDSGIGTPQGGVISPLLANIYLDQIETYWASKGATSTMIRYADDLIVVLNKKEEEQYQQLLQNIEGELKLKINHEKSGTENIKDGVGYLGFTLRVKTSKNNKQYLSIEPSKKALKRIRERIKGMTKKFQPLSTQEIVEKTNRVLRGWQQYFDNIAMGKVRSHIKLYTELRMAKLISKRNKSRRIKWKLVGYGALYEKYGLYKMQNLGRKFA